MFLLFAFRPEDENLFSLVLVPGCFTTSLGFIDPALNLVIAPSVNSLQFTTLGVLFVTSHDPDPFSFQLRLNGTFT